MPKRLWALPVFFALGVFLFVITGRGEEGSGSAKLAGRSELVFDGSKSSCQPVILPDAPARAFRDFRGRTQLPLSWPVNGRMVGKDLLHLKARCEPTLVSLHSADPSQFADREWISSTYTRDGKTIYTLVHNEFHGEQYPGMCAKQTFTLVEECWYNAISLAVSRDGGRTFSHADPPGQLVASTPYRYVPNAGPMGIFQPSNVIYRPADGHYYVLVHAQEHQAQDNGVCVMRTRHLDDPRSWRAWNGKDYSVRFIDPYRELAASADSHVCRIVGPHQIADMTASLTYNTYFKRFLLVGTAGKEAGAGLRWGFYFSLSDDLIHWSKRRLIRETELTQTFRCGDNNPLVHPSVLDPDSRSRNYETSDRRAYLFYTRLNYKDCKPSLDFDLIRVPIEFSK